MKRLLIPIAIVGAFAAGALATAATGWRTFATGSDQGDYGAYVSASADIIHPAAVAIRVTEKADLSWSIDCEGETKTAAANTVIAVSVAAAKTCHVHGDANTEGAGKLTLELLKR